LEARLYYKLGSKLPKRPVSDNSAEICDTIRDKLVIADKVPCAVHILSEKHILDASEKYKDVLEAWFACMWAPYAAVNMRKAKIFDYYVDGAIPESKWQITLSEVESCFKK
jgi:hypothetical protein